MTFHGTSSSSSSSSRDRDACRSPLGRRPRKITTHDDYRLQLRLRLRLASLNSLPMKMKGSYGDIGIDIRR